MLKRRSKHFALLLVLTMLATMFVGIGTVSASSSYSAASVPTLQKDTLAGAGGLNSPFNRVTVRIPKGQLLGATDFRISLPDDYFFIPFVDADKVPVSNQIGTITITPETSTVETYPGTTANYPNNTVPAIIPTFGAAYTKTNAGGTITVNGAYDGKVYHEWIINVAPKATPDDEDCVFYIDLYNTYIKSGANEGDVALTVNAPPTSSLSSGQVVLATIGAGTISISIDDVETVTSAGGTLNTLKIKEDRAGALEAKTDSIKLKLPNGFSWNLPAAPTVAVSKIWGTTGTLPVVGANFALADNERTLKIAIPAVSTDSTYFSITGLSIDVDESTAKTGDVVATISGSSSCKQSDLTVATYGDYTVTAAAWGDPMDVIAGSNDEEIGGFKISESVKGSLVKDRTITLQLLGGAKWTRANIGAAPTDAPVIKSGESKNYTCFNGGAWAFVGDEGDTIKYTIQNTSTAKAEVVFNKAKVAVNPSASGDIKIKVGGTAGATGEITVAKAVAPVVGKVEGTVPDLVIGKTQELPPIIIEEQIKEAIDSDSAALGGTWNNEVRVLLPYGVYPGKPGKVEVIAGDLQIDQSTVTANAGFPGDGRWSIVFKVRGMSSTPAKIKISGVKVQVDRTVAEGPILADIRGGGVVKTTGAQYFPGDGYVGSKITVANCVSAANDNVTKQAEFVIGATTFKLNGVETTMDVAPYIKDSRTYMPIRYVANALGIADSNIIWDGVNQTVTLMKGDKVVQVKIGSKNLQVNGASVTMDVAPEVTNSRTMLPISFIANAFGATAGWDAATQTVTIK